MMENPRPISLSDGIRRHCVWCNRDLSDTEPKFGWQDQTVALCVPCLGKVAKEGDIVRIDLDASEVHVFVNGVLVEKPDEFSGIGPDEAEARSRARTHNE